VAQSLLLALSLEGLALSLEGLALRNEGTVLLGFSSLCESRRPPRLCVFLVFLPLCALGSFLCDLCVTVPLLFSETENVQLKTVNSTPRPISPISLVRPLRSWIPLAFVVADLQVGPLLALLFLLDTSLRALFAS